MGRAPGLILAAALLVGCAATPRPADPYVEAIQASGEIPEAQLLDVGIALFDPGVGARGDDPKQGIYRGVREAEARYLPAQLKDTLQNTGQWGMVRVVPENSVGLDVQVSGEILKSDSETLALRIMVRDSTQRHWYTRDYQARVDAGLYAESASLGREPYQQVFNRIANDLLAFRETLDGAVLVEVRRVAELRFAQDLSPDAFAGYLQPTPEGRLEVVRLPAHDDPMLLRVRQVRERDFLLLDTLNEHYLSFHRQMESPYQGWRQFSYEELLAKREIERRAFWQKAAGVAAIAGAILMDGGSSAAEAGRTVLIIGGVEAIQAGIQTSREAVIHQNALLELGRSFSAEIEPVVVEVRGETRRLEGSAEAQYQEWRELLRAIYGAETGFLEAAPKLVGVAAGEPDVP